MKKNNINNNNAKCISKESQWKIFAITMTIFALIISIAFAVTGHLNSEKDKKFAMRMDDLYSESYYDLMFAVSSMETDLSKLEVSNDGHQQMLLLSNIEKLSGMAGDRLSMFQSDNNFVNFTRYVNQVGDFSSYLMEKVARGEKISEKEYIVISDFIKVAGEVKGELAVISEEINQGNFSFYKHFSNDENTITTIFSDLDGGSLNYPSLIYDGPFSDALSDRVPKELNGDVYDSESGKEIAKKYIQNADEIKSIDFSGITGGKLVMLAYDITMNNGDKLYTEITATGGKLCSLSRDKVIKEQAITKSEAILKGKDYLSLIGIKDMHEVWIAEFDNLLFVNFATKKEGIIVYSELIKVKISMDTGAVLGVEALNYIYNYSSSRILSPVDIDISEEDAMVSVRNGFAVDNVQLCLIPMPAGREVLCYEISGVYKEKTYYIYIDAKSGNEVNILKVIGNLLQ